ncbi:AAA family ATPase [Streptococcus suis]|uniref:AAA family ATPase n=1 Tax=Streptococcus sp. HN38 TaxID=3020829 RepID=UPI001551E7D6|nr:AAA family ATPase [Streptococcus sp. HN38]NQN67730.1 ATP-binding protein [Streptococcus suis]
MKLKIENIGKIRQAEIKIDGLTLIAGTNATGKSTIGKSLFSIFNSFYKVNQTYRKYKEEAIDKRIRDLDDYLDLFIFSEDSIDATALLNSLLSASNSNDIQKVFDRFNLDGRLGREEYNKLFSEIEKINNTTIEQVLYDTVDKNFFAEFSGNINNVTLSDKVGSLNLIIKENSINLRFLKNNLIQILNYFSLNYIPIYIDDAFIVDSYNFDNNYPNEIFFPRYEFKNERTHRQVLLSQYSKSTPENPIDNIIIKSNLQIVYDKLSKVLDDLSGISYSYYNKNDGKPTLSINNLSSGMKSFYLLKKLLDNGSIVENSPVILDEPENHLHPEWQLILAEIIILLQKELSLHFLINTHSPYFLRAIEVYADKYQINHKINYYEARQSDEFYSVIEQVDETRKIYKSLAAPLKTIELERGL